MTVTLLAKHDVTKAGDNTNGTCCTEKSCETCNGTSKSSSDGNLEKTQRTDDASDPLINDENCKANCKGRRPRRDPRLLFDFEQAPSHMKHNIYIRRGYRGLLNCQNCLASVFWWSNETINIWSHLFGLFLFTAVEVRDLSLLKMHATLYDKVMVSGTLVCFQLCMFLSALYHTFCCRSQRDCELFLSLDLFGIALSLLAIYTSGIYYAFWCDQERQNMYLLSVTAIFIFAMALQFPAFGVHPSIKMTVFVMWALYGVIPTFHWFILMGGISNPVVLLLFPRVLVMYMISGTAFGIYITKVPERFGAGKFDYFGHSHQWWHIFVVLALYYWHNTGMLYVEYRMTHACASTIS